MRTAISSRRLNQLAFILFLIPSTAFGQADQIATFEGHVFEAKTLRPLNNVLVVFEETLTDGTGRSTQMPTDVNGFYTLDMTYLGTTIPANVVATRLSATCFTRRGDVQNTALVARPVRTNGVPYRRDFYVALPRNISRCSSLPVK